MKKIKVVTLVGTRPEIIRLSRVIAKLNSSKAIHHILIHSGQNYDHELNRIFFDDLEIKEPDYFLNAAGNTSSETIANTIKGVDHLLAKLKPDAFLVLGDTNSCLGVIAAKKRHIPAFHMEAGNRCFDMRVPEEINRRIVDGIADINLTYSDISREYLIHEGFPADRVIKTGSPMKEIIDFHLAKAESSTILGSLGVKPSNYFLVSSHREENIDSDPQFDKLIDIISSLGKEFKVPVIVSTHPRTKNRIKKKKITFARNIQLCKPFSFTDYLKLQLSARVVLSDSGTISEESSILNFPALNIREAHERPEAMEEGSVMMVGMNKERIFQAIEQVRDQRSEPRNFQIVSDYNVTNVSDKVVRIIISYIDYVRRKVWFEN